MNLVGTHRLFGAISRRLMSLGSAVALFGSVLASAALVAATPSFATVPVSAGCTAVNGGAFNWSTSNVAAGESGELGPLTFFAGEVISVSFSVTTSGISPGGGAFILAVSPYGVVANRFYELFGPGGLQTNNVTSGQYTITGTGDLSLVGFSGVGNGAGSHSMTTTVTCAPAVVPGSLSGRYFQDLDVSHTDNAEPGIEGVLVSLLNAGGTATGATTTTGADGSYSFTDLPPGTYGVRFTDPDSVLDGFELVAANVGDDINDSDAIGDTTLSTISNIVVVAGQDTPDNDAGARLVVTTGTITIVKDTIGGDGTFSFNGDLGDFDLTTLNGTISRSFNDQTPGTFDVTELASTTHILSGLSCDDPTSDTTTSGATATIDLVAGETVTCTYTNTEVGGRTAAIIAGFLERRAGTLTEAGPTLQHFLDRFTGNAEAGFSSEILSYQEIPNGGGGAEFDAVMMDPGARWAFWLEGTFERYREGGPGTEINGGVAMLQGGFDVLLGDNLIVGVTAVGDGARELSTDLGYFVEGLGWMAGPYGAVRLAEGVVFDAKFLWGQSWNDISPFLTYTDQFTTTSWLATARLAGEAAIGPLMFRPEIYVAYFSETQAEYVDTNGITIPEQTIALGRLTFGPEIAIPVRTSNGGMIEPRIAMEGVWDFIGTRPLSARVNGGIQFSGAGGASLLLSGGYGGLFAPAFSNWNVRANITVPLQ